MAAWHLHGAYGAGTVLACPILANWTCEHLFHTLVCPFLQNRTYKHLVRHLVRPILQKRTRSVPNHVPKRPILQNRTREIGRNESKAQERRENHTLINEPVTTSATPIQNGIPNATPSNNVLDAVEKIGVAYEPIANVSILP